MLLPSPKWLDTGDNAWQLAAATFVGLQSIPGLVVLYGGIAKKKWAINSAFMALYAFAAVMVVWVLWAYNMGFGPQWMTTFGDGWLGTPMPGLSAVFETQEATIPAAAGGMPPIGFPMATMMFFQFVFAAITVIILAGSVLGRMNFIAWMVFVPLWMTFIYTIGAFSLWGGGWLSAAGAVDFSGGYVIHLAAGTSGFVAAAVVGPRIKRDRDNFQPNNLLMTLTGAGILWLGWDGFNGGDPYFANADAGAAVLNTNITTAVSLLVWTLLDTIVFKKPSVLGAVNGMIAGLVAITPAAGFVNGEGAIILGVCSGIIPWLSWNVLGKTSLMSKVDDTLGVIHTHGVAAIVGGLLTGILADPGMLEYIGTDKDAPGFSVTGLMYGGGWHQFNLQAEAAGFIIVLNAIGTFVILKLISLVIPLRFSPETLEIGDDACHGEEAYAIYGEGDRNPSYIAGAGE